MAILPLSEMPIAANAIDLTGSAGNAFSLIAQANTFCRNLGWSKERTDEIQKQMKASDYENLLLVFDENFGDYCTLYR